MKMLHALGASVFAAALSFSAPVFAQTERPGLQELDQQLDVILENLSGRPALQRQVLTDVSEALENAAQAPQRVDELIGLMQGVITDFGDDAEYSTALGALRQANEDLKAELGSRDQVNAALIAQLDENIADLDAQDTGRARIVSQALNAVRDLERRKVEIADAVAVAGLTEATRLLGEYAFAVGLMVDRVDSFITDATSDDDAEQDAP